MAVFSPGTASAGNSRIELSIECTGLFDADVFSKSDPFVVVYMQSGSNGSGSRRWNEIGRTEVIMNNLNPKFSKKFDLDYVFEVVQTLKFEVYDLDEASSKLDKHDFLGECQVNLGELVCDPNGISIPLKQRDGSIFQGHLKARAEELLKSREFFKLRFEANGVSKGLFGSGFFFQIERANEDGSFGVVTRSKVLTSGPYVWSLPISGEKLCNGDLSRTLRIGFWKYKGNGSHKIQGSFETAAKDLEQGQTWRIDKKASIKLLRKEIETKYTFVDFLQGGMEMNFVVSIDYTGSNGDPRDSRSLHYSGANQPTQYHKAIVGVGEVIKDYDTDKLFPVFGFGAKIPPNGAVSHMFPCNFNPGNPFMNGVDGILQAYYGCLPQIQLYGPTNFAPTILEVARMAKDPSNLSKPVPDYFVLMIITDGVITDMQATKRAIIDNSNLPFSIIIVGVGNADFDGMEELDSDDQLLSLDGATAKRDIVQFVPFRDFAADTINAKTSLAMQVLAEIPEQVTSYMFQNKKAPPPSY
ncbi:Oidioi.mRNA.OKI2018_I69.chr2.g6399.t1.cds [Oikopleura dioica]|uniref:Oidioi.mRNA.OKI2018_I69.chr2.g6399.t1.cds n=1 Tax=Oikopleura dioica TaxID=34765 RepID=A0ABN7T3D0_OIKDI|nr:Oidioi.mRNA.OKI2018_I69.chr2.g6399.t1.cds [Oikopleura dioica]